MCCVLSTASIYISKTIVDLFFIWLSHILGHRYHTYTNIVFDWIVLEYIKLVKKSF